MLRFKLHRTAFYILLTPPRSKNFKSQQSAGKVMVTVSWDSVVVILLDFMSKGATLNSDVYIDTLKKFKARIQRIRPALEMSKCNGKRR